MFEATENDKPNDELLPIIEDLDFSPQATDTQKITDVKAFGLNKEFNNEWWFSYYIGLDYLDDNYKYSVHVVPKIENLNYIKMLKTGNHVTIGKQIFQGTFTHPHSHGIRNDKSTTISLLF
jgi:hypothetical protein